MIIVAASSYSSTSNVECLLEHELIDESTGLEYTGNQIAINPTTGAISLVPNALLDKTFHVEVSANGG